MDGRRLGTVTARENRDFAPGVAEFAGEFFDDRRFARTPDGEVADRDDLDAKSFVAQKTEVVKPAAQLDGDHENFRAAEKKSARELCAEIITLLEDDFEEESFKTFEPDPEFFAHRPSMCQARGVAARNQKPS